MLVPNRNFQSPEYRYGFNGKEKDDEVKGQGLQYDYGFRIYDPRLGKFLSMDPLLDEYPMLTPYQFASNTPIQAIDIDGKEGETYLETTIENGVEKVLHRVVEVDIFIAISRNKSTKHFYSKKPSKDVKIRQKILNDLGSKFIDGKFKDSDGNEIVWRFNVNSFIVDDKVSAESFTKTLVDDPKTFIDGKDGRSGIKAVIIQQEHLSNKAVFNPDTGQVKNVGNVDTMGYYNGAYIIGVNDEFIDKKSRQHTYAHEIGHFFVRKNPVEDVRNMDTKAKHNATGNGIFHYGNFEFNVTKKAIGDGHSDYDLDIKVNDRFELSQDDVNKILESVIDTGKKKKKEKSE